MKKIPLSFLAVILGLLSFQFCLAHPITHFTGQPYVRVIETLGDPKGTIDMDDKTILMYDRGNVHISQVK